MYVPLPPVQSCLAAFASLSTTPFLGYTQSRPKTQDPNDDRKPFEFSDLLTWVWPGAASKGCHDAFLWSLGDAKTYHLARTSLFPAEFSRDTNMKPRVAHQDEPTW